MRSSKIRAAMTLAMLLSNCRASVKTGLDNLNSYEHLFRSKRIGIITNHTGHNSNGRFIVDLFKDMPGVKVTAMFGPEHGFQGIEEAGMQIDNNSHPLYHVPIYSLYGKTQKPTPQMLADIDILVFDVQDVGARFYTYIYTMSLAMEAAAENGRRFVVLDRPNPIDGRHVEGNILEPEFSSFVGLYPIPPRYAMTTGELAAMVNGEGWLAGRVKADLAVVPLMGWRRTMWYDQTGLRFIKPSPNMPDLETAALYPGLCLLEGTNVSEGRGTDTPFRMFGAPWMDSKALAARLNALNLPGMRFEPVSFTPTASKYRGQNCHGVKVTVTNRDLLEPYWAGIRITNEVYRLYRTNFKWNTAHFDHLCGTSQIREAITNQAPLEQLRTSWQPKLESFLKTRNRYLLYPD